MQKQRKHITHNTTFGGRLDRYIDRKRVQPEEDQYYEAGVLISEMQTIDADNAFASVRKRISRRPAIQVLWTGFGRVAAILILPLLIYIIWDGVGSVSRHECEQLSYQEISNPDGIRSKVVLPDGSIVWLNAESTIRYSIPFAREAREVELTGEAFLDVAKNPGSPFEVKFDGMKVRVLGTRFNIKAYPGDGQMEVVLEEGSVQLDNIVSGTYKGHCTLSPDEQWVYDKTTKTAVLKNVDAARLVAWHKNMLILDKTPMAEVARRLERWYGVEVEILDSSLYSYKFTTVFENEPLHRVIELLEMSSPIKIRYLSGKPIAQTGETEKAVIQISAK